MNTKWNFLIVLVLLATLVGWGASAAQAQGGITGISPEEGTVGTQVTITGAGFGDKHGEVLLGNEKSKVLAWSDTEITFLVDKPQHPAEYAVTVLLQGDKKPEDLLTSSVFTMRRPKINPGELLQDGSTATVVGNFFGDKKGALRMGYLESGAVAVEDPKILDWSMNTIRFELPDGLVGKFVLAISNEVGIGLALLDLGNGPQILSEIPDPPGWPGGNSGYSSPNNGSGVYYKGKFYVVSTAPTNFPWEYPKIKFRTFNTSTHSFSSYLTSQGGTYAIPTPVLVGDKLWIIYPTSDRQIEYQVWNGTNWETNAQGSVFTKILDYKTDNTRNEVAAVYNPVSNKVTTFIQNSDQVAWAYSNDLGKTWTKGGTIAAQSCSGVSALYSPGVYQGKSYDILLAVTNCSWTMNVYAISNGTVVGNLLTVAESLYGRAHLVDLDPGYSRSGYIVLFYGKKDNTPMMRMMDKLSRSWGAETQAVTLPETSLGEGYYIFHAWGPSGVISPSSGSEDRHLYLFYGYDFMAWFCTDFEDCGPWWKLIDIKTFKTYSPQVSTGQMHTCSLTPAGMADCWGSDNYGNPVVGQQGPYTQISSGVNHICALTPTGAADCWGDNSFGQAADQPGPYTQISAGYYHTCALTPTGAADCWGNNRSGEAADQPGPYTQISAGGNHTCTLTPTGAADCWGYNQYGQAADQPGPYAQISAGGWHTCALTPTGAADCWGYGAADQPGPYTQISAGEWHTCALTPTGAADCWGDISWGKSADQPGPYTQISAGGDHTCALTPTRAADCWGRNDVGQCDPPY